MKVKASVLLLAMLVCAGFLAVATAAEEAGKGSTSGSSTLSGIRRMLRWRGGGWGGQGGYYGGGWGRGYGWGYGGWAPFFMGPSIPDEGRMETSNDRRFARVMSG